MEGWGASRLREQETTPSAYRTRASSPTLGFFVNRQTSPGMRTYRLVDRRRSSMVEPPHSGHAILLFIFALLVP